MFSNRGMPCWSTMILYGLKYICICLLLVTLCHAKNRNNLLDDLLNSDVYDSKVRPVPFYNESLKIKFKMYFNQILDVSEVSQKIETKVWLSHIWSDPRLEWDPQQYDGIKSIHVPTTDNRIWLPILVLYNNADGDFSITKFTKATVNYKGIVEWKPPAIFKSFCEIKVADFPFDTQNCTMKIGLWSEGQNLIDMVNSDGEVKNHTCDNPDVSTYKENGEWDLLTTGCYKHYVNYTCCIGAYVDMTYYFKLQRRPLYLIINILFPTMLFSFLTCAVFYLPSDAGEKMTLSISLLLSLIVFLLVVVETVPSTAKGVPLLCQYIVFTMVLVCLSIMITVVVLNVHYRGSATHVMSDRVKKIFMVWLPKLIFSSTMKKMDPYKSESEKTNQFCKDISDISGRDVNFQKPCLLRDDVQRAVDGVNFVSEYFQDQKESQEKEDQWKYVAMVIDHFLLYIFIALCLFGTIGIFGKRLIEFNAEKA
ncbi:acetylcholine receptor subunit alpha-like isoform X2 [Clavelina lepadiformis]|uniref:Uncharacterized protein n=1 Tax=Clavelina lepadiformis TaxID=159417 RepID=A0ABP0EXS6_CLALP